MDRVTSNCGGAHLGSGLPDTTSLTYGLSKEVNAVQPLPTPRATVARFLALAALRLGPDRSDDVSRLRTALDSLLTGVDKNSNGAGAAAEGERGVGAEADASSAAEAMQEWLIANHHRADHHHHRRCGGGTEEGRHELGDGRDDGVARSRSAGEANGGGMESSRSRRWGIDRNVYSHTFFRCLHLRCKDPLPFSENFSVLLSPLTEKSCAAQHADFHGFNVDPPLASNLLRQAACMAVAGLEFWLLLLRASGSDEVRESFLRDIEGHHLHHTQRATIQEVDMRQYYDLFGSHRTAVAAEDEEDHQIVAWRRYLRCRKVTSTAEAIACLPRHIVVAFGGKFFRVQVFRFEDSEWEEILRGSVPLSSRTISAPELFAVLKRIVQPASTKDESQFSSVGFGTCPHRTDAAFVRDQLIADNKDNLQSIEDALFVLCVDWFQDDRGHSDEDFPELEMQRYRNVFNYVRPQGNRWFDKGMQFIASPCGPAQAPRLGINFEHSFADSGVCHKLCSFLYLRAQELRNQHSETEEGGAQTWDAKELEWNLSDSLREQLSRIASEAVSRGGQVGPNALDFVSDTISRDYFKHQHISPDSCFQIGKHAYNLETIDVRHFRDGRLIVADTLTPPLRLLVSQLLTTLQGVETSNASADKANDLLRKIGSDKHYKKLLFDAVAAHGELIARNRSGEEAYLHMCYLTNEFGWLADPPPHPVCEDPIYGEIYEHSIASSNLGNDIGIEFVYSGLPTKEGLHVVGYMLADSHTKLTITSRTTIPTVLRGNLEFAFRLVKAWTA